MQRIETLVSTQITGPATLRQFGVLGGCRGGSSRGRSFAGAACEVFGRFHSHLPFARHGRDSSLPGQRKSHSSHSLLLGYRRRGEAEGQGTEQQLPPRVLGCGSLTN